MTLLPEGYENVFTTTLNGSIDNAATTIVVHDAVPASIPAGTQFRVVLGGTVTPYIVGGVTIGNIITGGEVIIVPGGLGTTWTTVVRGAEGTTAVAHDDGDTVVHILSREGLLTIVSGTQPTLGYDQEYIGMDVPAGGSGVWTDLVSTPAYDGAGYAVWLIMAFATFEDDGSHAGDSVELRLTDGSSVFGAVAGKLDSGATGSRLTLSLTSIVSGFGVPTYTLQFRNPNNANAIVALAAGDGVTVQTTGLNSIQISAGLL